MTDLYELKALALKATPGPWEYDWTDQEGDYARQFVVTTSDIGAGYELFDTINRGYRVSEIEDDRCEGPNGPQGTIWDEAARNDAAFIAAANPKTILDLISRLEKAEGERTTLSEALSTVCDERDETYSEINDLYDDIEKITSANADLAGWSRAKDERISELEEALKGAHRDIRDAIKALEDDCDATAESILRTASRVLGGDHE